MANDETLIAGVLEHQPGRTDPGLDAAEQIDEIVRQDPLRALRIVREVLQRSPSAEFTSYIAAGPLENLICHHGSLVLEAIEANAPNELVLRRALAGVLLGEESGPDIHAWLARLAIAPAAN